MLSLPENWDYTLKGLSIINKESVDTIREAVKELEGERYVIRTRKHNEKGQLTGITKHRYRNAVKCCYTRSVNTTKGVIK